MVALILQAIKSISGVEPNPIAQASHSRSVTAVCFSPPGTMESHRTGPPPSRFHYLLFHSLSRKNMCWAEGREEDQAACLDLEGRPATAASTGRRTRPGGLRGGCIRDQGALARSSSLSPRPSHRSSLAKSALDSRPP